MVIMELITITTQTPAVQTLLFTNTYATEAVQLVFRMTVHAYMVDV